MYENTDTFKLNQFSYVFAGAAQSSIECPCRSTRAAAATAAPSSTSSPSAATITSGRGRRAVLSSHWQPLHSRTPPTEPSAWEAQWGRPCPLRGWREALPSHAASAVMADLWTRRGYSFFFSTYETHHNKLLKKKNWKGSKICDLTGRTLNSSWTDQLQIFLCEVIFIFHCLTLFTSTLK